MLRFQYFQFLKRFLFGILTFFLFFSLFRHFPNQNENFQSNRFVIVDRIFSSFLTRVEISKHSIVNYLREYRTTIEGSVTNELLYTIWILVQFQYRWLDSIGSIGEIGFHQGQLTSFLYLMRRFREQNLFAIESNRKSKKIFLQNVLQYADVYENELNIYFGSTLDFNPIFSNSSTQNDWWSQSVIAERGIQLISINGSRSELLTYADLCLISKSLIDGGVVIIDETFPFDLSTIRHGILRFLSETSTFIQDEKLKDDLSQRPNETNIRLSKRLIRATTPTKPMRHCSRLVPFLYYSRKLFLTTPNFYPQYIELIGSQENFANVARDEGISYLEYHALYLTLGNVPVWMNNHRLESDERENIFHNRIENIWRRNFLTSNHFRFSR